MRHIRQILIFLTIIFVPSLTDSNTVKHNSSSRKWPLPFPPQNYGQYNSPITQEDISHRDYSREVDDDILMYTNEITLRQGRLRGVIRNVKHPKLYPVRVYLGIPYAAPPVGALRFMPPGSPPNWPQTRIFDHFEPVCPQKPPDLTNEPLRTLNQQRYNYLKVLLPFLANQSEDCLYLNIYAPSKEADGKMKFPVLVYIHGESFDWNSGNPYDGSVLASYGNVIVVTVNFRLGILGFLRPGISDITISNFGLLDQIAALQWVKDNIAKFGGDPNSVTLMGHGTGAACINFLMVSPVSRGSNGLFHRAILMSGTALSDWALTLKPIQITIQVAEALNCPMADDELANCLRRKRLSDIMKVNVTAPEFETPFGPLVDGNVIPNNPEQVMGVYRNLFSRYELLYGMTEIESYHSLNAVSLTYGLLERERQQLLWQYMRAKFEQMPDLALATTISQYTNWRKAAHQYYQVPLNVSDAEEHRDIVLDILSDARVAAPMVRMADYHCRANPKSYFYIFNHNSQFGEFSHLTRSIGGEEISYVFGIPLLGGKLALGHHTFSLPERLLSEVIISFFINFVKTGNPNSSGKNQYLTLGQKDWSRFDIKWPEYEPRNQSYMTLGTYPHVGHFYREAMLKFWNKDLPNLLANPPTGARKTVETYMTPETKSTEHEYKPRRPEFIYGKQIYKTPIKPKPTNAVYGVIKTNVDDIHEVPPSGSPKGKNDLMDGPMNHVDSPKRQVPEITTGNSMLLALLVIVGMSFLLIVFTVALLFYKKRALQMERQATRDLSQDSDDGGFGERERFRGCGRHIYDMVTGSRGRSEDPYEAVHRKYSESTVDPHLKVREWIIEKCSPAFLRRSRQVYGESPSELFDDENHETKRQQANTESESRKSVRKKVEKVSVSVDATPSARSASVLKQTPIELTKSLDRDFVSKLSTAETAPLRRSHTSVSLQIMDTNDSPTNREMENVNVTSRDDSTILPQECLPQETLKNIQRRNFPKVLPDFPEYSKRLSLQPDKLKPIPVPPPRISTLDRKLQTARAVINFCNQDKSVPVNVLTPSTSEVKKGPKTIISASSHQVKRNEPIFLISPKIGPTKSLTTQNSFPHVNVLDQAPWCDTKGPSDKTSPQGTGFEKVISSKPKKSSEKSSTSVTGSLNLGKTLVRANAINSSTESSSSSSIATESTGTVKRVGKN